ncbi:MAG: hypothetical protein JRF02_01280 [Deltaproteobacteria bacterium]|jgi:hypothetical protein|nr:hypothetical protein [Deltaproteobacteria bacterium]
MEKEDIEIIQEIIIEKIVGGIQCPKDYRCTKFGVKHLCKAKDIGKEDCLQCLEEDPSDCPFVSDIGYYKLCQCPLRIYIAKNLKK